MPAQGRGVKTQYDLFDVPRQPFRLLCGIMTLDILNFELRTTIQTPLSPALTYPFILSYPSSNCDAVSLNTLRTCGSK